MGCRAWTKLLVISPPTHLSSKMGMGGGHRTGGAPCRNPGRKGPVGRFCSHLVICNKMHLLFSLSSTVNRPTSCKVTKQSLPVGGLLGLWVSGGHLAGTRHLEVAAGHGHISVTFCHTSLICLLYCVSQLLRLPHPPLSFLVAHLSPCLPSSPF